MQYFKYIFTSLLLFIIAAACNHPHNDICKIHIKVLAPAEGKLELIRIGFIDQKDSIFKSSENGIFNDFTFEVKKDPTTIYKLKVPLLNRDIFCIPDVNDINIEVNLAGNIAMVNGSESSTELLNFIATLKKQNNNLLANNINVSGHSNTEINFTLPFMDSVSNPAIFMVAYNTIEFGKDYKLLKEVVDKAFIKFPKITYIKQLKEDANNMIDVYEKEFNINDQLPAIILLDIDSTKYSTAANKGKYYYINFWSTWCEQCFTNLETMKNLYANIDTSRISFVSTAIDNNHSDWKQIINKNNYSWKNLIDEKMWKGIAVNTLKFDSIPFNFLVSPEGKVLGKAIPPDSLQYYLAKFNLLKRK